ncbi:hypothetical protein HYU94_02605 [Candidatus Daviesbacteria bacterium]|nr:hypothetical protein [Candidatus Daviesbacteria bacterium]
MQNTDAGDFYNKVISIIIKHKILFVIGGGLAVFKYTDLNRPTNDLDIYCKGGDYPKIITILKTNGVETKILDERWIAQALPPKTNNHNLNSKTRVDILFSSPSYLITVDDLWFEYASEIRLFGQTVKLAPREELVWSKAYIQDRNRFDGADINHLILTSDKKLDWKRLLMRMENNWEILLSLLINFRFIYPSKRDLIPKWLLEELISRLNYQLKNPIPRDKICRGPLLSRTQYKDDITKLGFTTIS